MGFVYQNWPYDSTRDGRMNNHDRVPRCCCRVASCRYADPLFQRDVAAKQRAGSLSPKTRVFSNNKKTLIAGIPICHQTILHYIVPYYHAS